MLTDLLTLPVMIIHRADTDATDVYGNPVPAETQTTTVGELQQVRRSEPGDQGELSDTTWDLFLPAGTDIRTGDQVIARDEVFEVTGEPWHARDPRNRTEHHVEVTLRKTAGSEDAS